MKELYDVDIFDSTISRITGKIMPVGRKGMAGKTARVGLYSCIYGCYPLSCEK